MEDEVLLLVDLYRRGVDGVGMNGNCTGSTNGGAELCVESR